MKRTDEHKPDVAPSPGERSSAPGTGGSVRERARSVLGNRGFRTWLRETLRPDGSPGDPVGSALESTGRTGRAGRTGGDGGAPPVLPPDDPLEREADRVAERAADAALGSAPPEAAGKPSRPGVDELEVAFGRDFSDVRVHTDAQAADAARTLGARAFTVGRDVFVGAGEPGPSTREGRRLLAHELTHVVHNGEARPAPGASVLPVAGLAPAGGAIARSVSHKYETIKEDLTYRFTDWAITDAEAREVIEILAFLNDQDLHDTVRQMERDGLVVRLFDNLPDKDRAKNAAVIQRIQGFRPAAGLQSEIEDLLSYGVLDWAVTEEEAHRALETLKDLKSSNDAKWKRVVRSIQGKYYERFLDNLSDQDKADSKKFLDDVRTVRATGFTHEDASDALESYARLGPDDRKKQFDRDHPTGRVANLLRALTPADAAGRFTEEVRELLRWTEEAETRAASGMTDDEMAKLQTEFMRARRKKTAEAKIEKERKEQAKAGKPVPEVAPPPTAEQLKEAHVANVAQGSVAKKSAAELEYEKKKDEEKKKWEERGKAVITALVARIRAKHPELKLTADNFLAEFEQIEKRGKRVFAMGRTVDGVEKCVFGQSFVETAEADVDYVMSTVVHEIFGHPEFGVYGTEYHLQLYDAAAGQMEGYVKPVGDERTSEIDNFAYHGTEIYAELRGAPYEKDLSEKHRKKGVTGGGSAAYAIEYRVKKIKENWHPKLSPALARGLYQRFRIDPRITPASLKLYEQGVRKVFGKEADAILK